MKVFVVIACTLAAALALPMKQDAETGMHLIPADLAELDGFGGDIDEKIINGEDAQPGQYPHHVLLLAEYKPDPRYMSLCGASILSKKIILTAAHCTYGQRDNPSKVWVIPGIMKLRDYKPSLRIPAARNVIHPGFKLDFALGIPNDIAVLELTKEIEFTDKVSALTLPTQKSNHDGTKAELSGFGRAANGKLAPNLQRVELDIVSLDECKKTYPNSKFDSTRLCIFTKSRSACQGDSGGPLVKKVSGKFVHTGIVSWGRRSCVGYPAVFTNTDHYLDWIKKTAGI